MNAVSGEPPPGTPGPAFAHGTGIGKQVWPIMQVSLRPSGQGVRKAQDSAASVTLRPQYLSYVCGCATGGGVVGWVGPPRPIACSQVVGLAEPMSPSPIGWARVGCGVVVTSGVGGGAVAGHAIPE